MKKEPNQERIFTWGRRRTAASPEVRIPDAEEIYSNKVRFECFGITFRHPILWRIVPAPAQTILYDDGMVKFEENVPNVNSRVTAGIRWSALEEISEQFLENYTSSLIEESRKKFKSKKEDFRVLHQEICRIGSRDASFVDLQYKTTQGIFNSLHTLQTIRVLNMAYVDESSKRIMVANIISSPQYMTQNYDHLYEILTSAEFGE